MPKPMTLKEISMLSGVSIATASRYLASPEQVKPSTRKKIDNSIRMYLEKSGKGRSKLIAFVIPDITNQFFPLMLKGIESISRSQGYTLLVCNSEGNTKNEDKILENLLEIDVAGILFICSGEPSKLLTTIINDKLVPIVFLDRKPGINGVHTVAGDNREGMYQASKYILSLGHRAILYIGSHQSLSTEQERYQGFCKAFQEMGIPMDTTTRIVANFDKDVAYEQVHQLLLDHKPFPYTAICASNDLMALGAKKALEEQGIRIPQDISVIGYDDIPIADMLGLTTIRQPFEEMGRTAMLNLFNTFSDPFYQFKEMTLSTGIIIRNSCMAAPHVRGTEDSMSNTF